MKEGYSVDEVMSKPDGLAVVAVFVQIGKDASSLSTLNAALSKVVERGDTLQLFNYSAKVALPRNTNNFYRYEGSLTTPGCNEAVIWTLMAEPITITQNQVFYYFC